MAESMWAFPTVWAEAPPIVLGPATDLNDRWLTQFTKHNGLLYIMLTKTNNIIRKAQFQSPVRTHSRNTVDTD